MIEDLAALVAALTRATAARPALAPQGEAGQLLGMLATRYGDAAPVPVMDAVPGADAVPGMDAAVAADAIGHLCDVFDLTDTDRRILVAAAAADIDVRFTALYGLLLGSDAPRPPTVGLLLELCDGDRPLSLDTRQRLAPSRPLRRYRLVEVDDREPALWRSVSVPDRVVAHLLGDATPAPDLADLLVPDVWPHPAPQEGRLCRALRAGARICHVRSARNGAGLALAQDAFAALQVASITVDLGRAPASAHLPTLVALACREAGLQRCGLIIAEADRAIGDDPSVLAVVERCPMPVVVVDQLDWATDWVTAPMTTVTPPPEPRATREALWRHAVPGIPVTDDRDWYDLVSLRLSRYEIAGAARSAAITARIDGRDTPTVVELRDAARIGTSRALRGTAVRVQPRATLDDLVLPAATRESLADLVHWGRHREALLATGSLAGKGSKGRGVTALFAGSPGTGKTLAAEAVAGELGMDLYAVDVGAVVDKYIGETEKKLERVIREAENLDVVLFFDEADSLFGARAEVRDARDRYANQSVSYLLQRIERFEGIAILATNLRGNIDAAFSRRLHHVITFLDPDVPTRRGLWTSHRAEAPRLDESDPPDIDYLAQHVEVTGGTIRNIVMAAAFSAATADEPLGMRHLSAAIRREFDKLGRRMNGTLPPAVPAGRAERLAVTAADGRAARP